MNYTNPIIPGFHPDPSICRVGDDYYIVTSSFEFFPGVPIYHSRDLVNWRQIGHCLTRESQLSLQGQHASAGIYAPTIRHHNGRFYMTTTNTGLGKHLIVWADDPAGEWSEPVWLEKHGYMDPSLFFDADGRVYFTSFGNFGQSLIQTEIDIQTGARRSETRELWPGTGGASAEGPHLYKINGFYYLLLGEGGTEYGHMVTLARSKTPWGPWEECPYNPILTNRSRPGGIQCIGHGDLVEDHRGNWWMVCLGVRLNVGYPFFHTLGRETFLAPVRWENGWPLVGDLDAGRHGRILPEMAADRLPPQPWPALPVRDDFTAPQLGLAWNFLRNPRVEDWSLATRPGWLRLNGSAVTLDAEDSPAFVGRRQEHFKCVVRARLEFKPQHENEEAGLVAYMSPQHHYEIAVKDSRVIVRRRVGSLVVEVASVPVPTGPVVLSIVAEPHRYQFLLGEQCLAEGETKFLSTEVAGGFTGVYFAMYATGNGQRSAAPADFDWFDYEVVG